MALFLTANGVAVEGDSQQEKTEGAIECVASVLQLRGGYVHPSINCEDLHEKLTGIRKKIPAVCTPAVLSRVLKVSFGFGDVNACIIFNKWEKQ